MLSRVIEICISLSLLPVATDDSFVSEFNFSSSPQPTTKKESAVNARQKKNLVIKKKVLIAKVLNAENLELGEPQKHTSEAFCPKRCLTTQHSALSTQHSALSTQHSALSTQHSALSTQHSAFSTQHSALSTQHSALSTQTSDLRPQTSDLRPQTSDLRPQTSSLVSRRARLRT